MSRRTQKGRLQELAEQIGWQIGLDELVEFLGRMVDSLPEASRQPFRDYYLNNLEVPKRADGNHNIHYYQRLYEARAALQFVKNMTVAQLHLVINAKEGGRW